MTKCPIRWLIGLGYPAKTVLVVFLMAFRGDAPLWRWSREFGVWVATVACLHSVFVGIAAGGV